MLQNIDEKNNENKNMQNSMKSNDTANTNDTDQNTITNKVVHDVHVGIGVIQLNLKYVVECELNHMISCCESRKR